jgi:hypothetical protein
VGTGASGAISFSWRSAAQNAAGTVSLSAATSSVMRLGRDRGDGRRCDGVSEGELQGGCLDADAVPLGE